MSSAMVIAHRKNNEPQQMQSERIKIRCIELLKLLDSNLVKKRLDILLEATKGNGTDLKFFNRWGYNNEQIKFKNGLTILLNLIQFQERLTFAELEYLSAKQQFAIAIINLRYETGTLLVGQGTSSINKSLFYTIPL